MWSKFQVGCGQDFQMFVVRVSSWFWSGFPGGCGLGVQLVVVIVLVSCGQGFQLVVAMKQFGCGQGFLLVGVEALSWLWLGFSVGCGQ